MGGILATIYRELKREARSLAEKARISIIVPVLDEEQAVPIFLAEVVPMLESVCHGQLEGASFEVVFIDDGSTDRTAEAIMDAAGSRPEIKLVRFSRNFGKESALAAGLQYASGAAVIPMDVDLQDPPEVVPRMVEQWLKGAEVVNAVRRRRDTDTAFKRFTARSFYKLYNRIADHPIKSDVGDFRLLDRAVVEALNQLSEGSRFTKALYSWVGYRNVDIEYDRGERSSGDSKWRFGRAVPLRHRRHHLIQHGATARVELYRLVHRRPGLCICRHHRVQDADLR